MPLDEEDAKSAAELVPEGAGRGGASLWANSK